MMPGWYPVPTTTDLGWWDGERWTDERFTLADGYPGTRLDLVAWDGEQVVGRWLEFLIFFGRWRSRGATSRMTARGVDTGRWAELTYDDGAVDVLLGGPGEWLEEVGLDDNPLPQRTEPREEHPGAAPAELAPRPGQWLPPDRVPRAVARWIERGELPDGYWRQPAVRREGAAPETAPPEQPAPPTASEEPASAARGEPAPPAASDAPAASAGSEEPAPPAASETP